MQALCNYLVWFWSPRTYLINIFDFVAVIILISEWNYWFWITVPVFNLISLSCNVWENSKLKLILWLLKSSWAISFNFDDCSWAWDGSAPVTKCIFWIFEHLRITSSESLKKFTIWWWALYLFWQFLDFCFPFSILCTVRKINFLNAHIFLIYVISS